MKIAAVSLARLDPTVDRSKKPVPASSSPDDMNAYFRRAIVAPMSTAARTARFRIVLNLQAGGA